MIYLQPWTGFWQNEPKMGDFSRTANDLAIFRALLRRIVWPDCGGGKVAKPMDRNECKDLHNLEKFVLWMQHGRKDVR
jgi:hypothetical protein